MIEKSKKILIFSTAYKPFIGGSEVAIENISSRLPDLFFDIITPRYRRALRSEQTGNIRVHRIGIGNGIDKYLFPIFGFLFGLYLIFRERYALIHAYQASYAAGAAWLVSGAASLPFLLTLQEGNQLDQQSLFVRSFRTFLIRQANHITAISSVLKKYALMTAPAKPITLIPNGVDIQTFSQATGLDRTDLSIPADAKVVLTISRLVYKNGVDILLDAFAKMRTEPRVLMIIGSGKFNRELQERAEALCIASQIRWLGNIPHEQIPKYFPAADVFVRTPRSEGLGNVFLEAMAAGVPVVAPLVGGIPDFLEDGTTGIVCTLDSDDVAKKLDLALSDPGQVEHITHEAKALVSQRYSWDHIAQQMRILYHQLL